MKPKAPRARKLIQMGQSFTGQEFLPRTASASTKRGRDRKGRRKKLVSFGNDPNKVAVIPADLSAVNKVFLQDVAVSKARARYLGSSGKETEDRCSMLLGEN